MQRSSVANHVYANRMGNGDEDSGDGWAFRGRGLIQITGRANYQALADQLGTDFVNQPDLLEQPEYATLSSAWFCSAHHLNRLADANDVEGITRVINGGLNGLDGRKARTQTALACFGG